MFENIIKFFKNIGKKEKKTTKQKTQKMQQKKDYI